MSDREEMFEEDDGSDDEQALFGAPGGDGARMFLDADQMLRHRREHRRQAAPGPPAAPAEAAPVQEAARVANPRVQRVHLPRTAGVPDELWLNFLKYLVEQGFSYVDRDNFGAVYERVRPE